MPRTSRKPAVVTATTAGLAAALLLTACSGSGGSAGSTANGSGTLVFGITADPTQMVPWTATS